MQRRSGSGTLVLAFVVFVAYLAMANLLSFLGLTLPLGTSGTDTVLILLLLLLTAVLILFHYPTRGSRAKT